MNIFISGVTEEFEACRDALAVDIRKINHVARTQKEFITGRGTLLEKLEEYIDSCDLVICLVGQAYGSGPKGDSRSYTQWEYYFACGQRLKGRDRKPKEMLIYFASEEYQREHPINQSDDLRENQKKFIETIRDRGRDRNKFDDLKGLKNLALVDLHGPKTPFWPRMLIGIATSVLFLAIVNSLWQWIAALPPRIDFNTLPGNKVLELIYQKQAPRGDQGAAPPEIQCDLFGSLNGLASFYLLRDGDSLVNGKDGLVMGLHTRSAGYLYAFNIGPLGTVYPLFGLDRSQPLPAEMTLTIPTNRTAFFVPTPTPGIERIYVVYCSAPWPELEQTLALAANTQPPAKFSTDFFLRNRGVQGTAATSSNATFTHYLEGKPVSVVIASQSIRATNSHLVIERWLKNEGTRATNSSSEPTSK